MESMSQITVRAMIRADQAVLDDVLYIANPCSALGRLYVTIVRALGDAG